ncbi:MAG: 4-hydroxy-tetrahydrodipicolinate reductase [Cyclobacteriaceae bacterium]
MKIALIGYGKMGKTIERLALERGHEISHRIDFENATDINLLSAETCDVAIEFSRPETAFQNISQALSNGTKVISGTTGWLEKMPEIAAIVKEKNGTFLHSSNYSIGVNIFFELNKWLAAKMKGRPYQLSMEEVHHTEKLDAPSGTAIRLAEGIFEENEEKKGWVNEKSTDQTKVGIISKREPNVPGTHTVEYASDMELIEIKHTAHSRDIFASGAIDVAEWIQNKTGVLTMNDYLNDID